MTSLGDTVNNIFGSLDKAGIPDARIESEVLVANLVEVPRHHIYAFQERELTSQHQEMIAIALDRRLKREPLAYILGKKEFYGIELAVGPGVLIPRPETERLVDISLECVNKLQHPRILEVGTGSGCISISIALMRGDAKILSIDISQNALNKAQENSDYHKTKNVNFLKFDFLKEILIYFFSKTLKNCWKDEK